MTVVRRRRGPNKKPASATAAQTPATSATTQAAEPTTQRRRRASVGGHALRLTAPQREGWTRRWMNDDANRIADAEELGYSHVSDTRIKSSGAGSVVSRLVGTKANGEPLSAFLMETPDELYAEGLAEKEAHSRQIDDAIKAGRDSTGQMPSNETYGQGSIKSDR
jgi:hypothetical protein